MKIFLLTILAFLFTSCWPTSLSFRDGSVPPEWKRFMVTTLENKAANAPISYSSQLSEKIKDGIQNRVGLSLVSNESDDPQITINGSIDSYNITPLSLQETLLRLKID